MAINGGLALGIAFSARDLAGPVIKRFKSRLDALKKSSADAAIKVDAALSKMRKGAVMLGVGVIALVGIS